MRIIGTSLAVGALLVGLALPAAPALAETLSPTAAAAQSGGFARSGGPVAPNTDGLHAVAAPGVRAFGAAPLPAAVSLERWTVAPGNQTTTNSCVAWTIGYSMLGWYSMHGGSARTYAPMYLYAQDHLDGDGGSTSQDAYAILTEQGIAPRSTYSRGDADWRHLPKAADRKAAAAHTTTTPHYLYSVFGSDVPGGAGRRAIETAIAARHPVALAIPIFKPFEQLSPTHAVLHGSAIGSQRSLGYHMVLVVGYSAKGVRVENSWGSQWGDGGFATLDWRFVERWSVEASWIAGFSRSVPAQAPAQPDRLTVDVEPAGDGTSILDADWAGTGDYDDAVRHPVASYTATLTGADGSVSTRTGIAPGRFSTVELPGLRTGVAYTLSVAAVNAVGPGVPQTVTVRPTGAGGGWSDPLDAAALPTPRMPAAAPTPAIGAAAPGLRWPAVRPDALVARWRAPAFTGHSAVDRYRVTVVTKRGTRTIASHTWTAARTERSLTVPFRSAAHPGSAFPPGRAPAYVIRIRAHNRSGKWGATLQTTTTVRWGTTGWSYRVHLD